jgi:hypothetical protein
MLRVVVTYAARVGEQPGHDHDHADADAKAPATLHTSGGVATGE